MLTVAQSVDTHPTEIPPRSDSTVLQVRVSTALLASGYTGMRHVRCDVREGMAILHGVVPSYHLKQLAQEILRKLDGVDLVINRIAVQWSGSE